MFVKSDLRYSYSWTEDYSDDDPRVSGDLDNTVCNIKSGYEMLFILNKIAQTVDPPFLASEIQKIEAMLKNFMPSEISVQNEVGVWVNENLLRYWEEV